jgi:hypothetical protein
MRLSMSEKNGITSAIKNANIHVTPIIPAQEAQATKEFECLCSELRKRRKKMKRAVTDLKGDVRPALEV